MVFIFSRSTSLNSLSARCDFNARFIVSPDERGILSEGLLIPFLIKFSLSSDNKIPFVNYLTLFCVYVWKVEAGERTITRRQRVLFSP